MTESGEHVFAISHRSRDALTETIGTEWAAAKHEAQAAAALELSTLNRLRKIGIYFQEACNHQQINFQFFEKWAKEYPETAKDISFDSAKACISVARKLKAEVTSLAEMHRFRQTAFECFELSAPATRTQAQHAREVNHWSELIRLVAALEKTIKVIREEEGGACLPRLAAILSKPWFKD